ncbi:MAG: hypothetical protein GY870_11605 [archaeon]|nr:hypothetical protein [archaeon]
MEPIEWVFTILSFVAYYFFISKKAGQANFRIIGLSLCLIVASMTSIFCFSIGVMSLVIINGVSIVFNLYGIYNCYKEIRVKKTEVIDEISKEIKAQELIDNFSIEFQKFLSTKITENLNK